MQELVQPRYLGYLRYWPHSATQKNSIFLSVVPVVRNDIETIQSAINNYIIQLDRTPDQSVTSATNYIKVKQGNTIKSEA